MCEVCITGYNRYCTRPCLFQMHLAPKENMNEQTKHLAHLSSGMDEAYWQRQVKVHCHYYLVGVLQEKSACTAV